MSDTPETDKKTFNANFDGLPEWPSVDASFAQQLEREIASLKKENAELRAEIAECACDCREALMAESMRTQRRVIDWRDQSDEGLRLRCGELSAQEIRTIRAVLNAILPPNSAVRQDDSL